MLPLKPRDTQRKKYSVNSQGSSLLLSQERNVITHTKNNSARCRNLPLFSLYLFKITCFSSVQKIYCFNLSMVGALRGCAPE